MFSGFGTSCPYFEGIGSTLTDEGGELDMKLSYGSNDMLLDDSLIKYGVDLRKVTSAEIINF